MQMKGNLYRGDGYIYQLVEVARKLYSPLDSAMSDVLGFSYTAYEKTIRYVFSQYGLRNAKFKTMIKALTSKSEPWLPSIKEGYIFRIYK